jgi:hypothetical protein
MAEEKGVVAHMLAGPELALNRPFAIRDEDAKLLEIMAMHLVSRDGALYTGGGNAFQLQAPMPCLSILDISNDGASPHRAARSQDHDNLGDWTGSESVFFRRTVHAYLCAVCSALGKDGHVAAVPVFPRHALLVDGRARPVVCSTFTGLEAVDASYKYSTKLFACVCEYVPRTWNLLPSVAYEMVENLTECVAQSIEEALRVREENQAVKNSPLVLFVSSFPRATHDAVLEVLDSDPDGPESIQPLLDACTLFVCNEDGKFPGWDDAGVRTLVCSSRVA